jgi:hypothetical protein
MGKATGGINVGALLAQCTLADPAPLQMEENMTEAENNFSAEAIFAWWTGGRHGLRSDPH